METTLNGSRRLLAICVAIIVCSCCCCSLSATELTLPTDVSSIPGLGELGSNYLPAGMVKSNITMQDLQKLLERKCQRAVASRPGGGDENDAAKLSANMQAAGGRLVDCVSGLVNISQVMEEVEKARPNGDLDVVFEKYCQRLPTARACLTNFNESVVPCLSNEERVHNIMMHRIVDRLLDFICYKNGDQIALFIAEEGPECLGQHRENIGQCLNKTFGHYLPSELNITTTDLPDLVLGPSQCLELYDLERCVVAHLDKCDNITPSNIIESMFRYVRRESHCQEVIDNRNKGNIRALRLTGGAAAADASWSAATALLLSLTLGITLNRI